MIFSRKEKIYDLIIGPVSKHTLKNNKKMILGAYEKKLNKIKTDDLNLLRGITSFVDTMIRKHYGCDSCSHGMNWFREAGKKVENFKKKYGINTALQNAFKSLEHIEEIEAEMNLVKKGQYRKLKVLK